MHFSPQITHHLLRDSCLVLQFTPEEGPSLCQVCKVETASEFAEMWNLPTRKPLIQEIGTKMRAPHRGIGETNTPEYRRSQGHQSHVLSNTEGLRNNYQAEHTLPYSGFLGA